MVHGPPLPVVEGQMSQCAEEVGEHKHKYLRRSADVRESLEHFEGSLPPTQSSRQVVMRLRRRRSLEDGLCLCIFVSVYICRGRLVWIPSVSLLRVCADWWGGCLGRTRPVKEAPSVIGLDVHSGRGVSVCVISAYCSYGQADHVPLWASERRPPEWSRASDEGQDTEGEGPVCRHDGAVARCCHVQLLGSWIVHGRYCLFSCPCSQCLSCLKEDEDREKPRAQVGWWTEGRRMTVSEGEGREARRCVSARERVTSLSLCVFRFLADVKASG